MCISNLEMYISNLEIYIFRLEIEFSSGIGNFFYGIRRLFARDSGKSYAPSRKHVPTPSLQSPHLSIIMESKKKAKQDKAHHIHSHAQIYIAK